ncbi:MAG: PAS domain-containing protein [Myxococcus sp.]|nr:PAS domain-containing protein [Myxococcus sp.]
MRKQSTTAALATLTGVLALLGIAGWVFDVEALRTFGAGPSPTKPNTALGLLSVAAGLLFLSRGRRWPALTTAAVSLGIGLTTVASTLAGWSPGIDHLWWRSGLPQRMSVATASALALVALGVTFALARPALLGLAQAAATAALAVAAVGLAGYTLGLPSLGGSAVWSTMALPTALALLLASAAVLLHTREGPLTRALLGPGAAAALGRRLAVLMVAVPWLGALAVVHLGGEAARAAALTISQVLVPAVALLLAGVLRFTATVSRHELDLGITLDSIGDAVLLTDARGLVARLNPVAEQLTGWSSSEAKGQPVERVFHIINEESRARVESPVHRVLREGVVVGLANHTLLVDRGGRERPIADSGAPVRGGDGALQGVVLVFRDMTDEHAAQRQLKRAAATLQSVMNAMPVGVVATRAAQVVWANPVVTRLLGAPSPEALVNRSLLDFAPPEDLPVATPRLEALAQGEALPPRRFRVRGPTEEVLVDAVHVPQPVDIDGEPARLTILQRVDDASALQLRLARQASFSQAAAELARDLAEASFDLSRILENAARLAALAPDQLCVVFLVTSGAPPQVQASASFAHTAALRDFASRFAAPFLAGPLGLRVLGGDVVELPGAVLRQQVSSGTASMLGGVELSAVLLQPLRAHGKTEGMLAVARTAGAGFDDDEKRYLADLADRTAQAIRNAQLYREVTNALEVLQRTEAELRHSQKLEALGQLAGGVAHDFNNLLTVILSVVELMLAGRSDEDPDRDDLRDIRDAATRAGALTAQLLAFSRKQVMKLSDVDVNATVRGLEGLLKPLLGEPIALSLSLAEGLPRVKADPALLAQVVMNLCVNARDAMPSGGRLVVTTALHAAASPARPPELPAGAWVCLAVTDEGLGISPEVQERLFEPFFTTKGPGKGTGLGLSTSYGIARQTGGTITVRSTPGQGATFSVWLPVFEGAPQAEAPRQPTKRPAGRGVVLLVEDDAPVREVAQRLLRGAGYQVHVAAGTTEARALVATIAHLDLLLTDMVMPDGGGRELADELLARVPGLKVLFMSGYTDDTVMRSGVRDGKLQLLQKPFTPATLLDAVATALG